MNLRLTSMTNNIIQSATTKEKIIHTNYLTNLADLYYNIIINTEALSTSEYRNKGLALLKAGKLDQCLVLFKYVFEAEIKEQKFENVFFDLLYILGLDKNYRKVINPIKDPYTIETLVEKLEQQVCDLKFKSSVDNENQKNYVSSQNINSQKPSSNDLKEILSFYNNRKFQHALKRIEVLLEQFGTSAILFNIKGAIFKNIDKLEESLAAYKTAIFLDTRYVDAYNNLGISLFELNRHDEAHKSYKKALIINYEHAETQNNIGNNLVALGEIAKAKRHFAMAIKIKPNYAEPYNNIGEVFSKEGLFDDAIEAYKQAIKLQPNHFTAYNNIGVLYKQQGRYELAISAFTKALNIQPDYVTAQYNLGLTLKNVVFTRHDENMQLIISSIIKEKTLIRPSDIVTSAISLLKLDPEIKNYLNLEPDISAELMKTDVVISLLKNTLLTTLMSVVPISDVEFEKLLTKIRLSLLISVKRQKYSPKILSFQSYLALQCYTNEYIYGQLKEEENELQILENEIIKTIKKGEQPSKQDILCLASYKPLMDFDWINFVDITPELADVFTRQVTEPRKERVIKADIKKFGQVTDEISSKVRKQYEENPYPRWVNTELNISSQTLNEFITNINLKLRADHISNHSLPNILIAGCGTGQHSIGTAARFRDSQVLAIDLSLSSLSYAKRKADELGVSNIRYMQGDILEVGALNQKFDLVESVGVLHHMNDPFAGWKELTNCLKLGGLMKIGLYSELARDHIKQIKQEIHDLSLGTSIDDMKCYRSKLMGSIARHHKLVSESRDFYSLSTFRDLLFHEKENTFTLPEIKNILTELGLRFCGFELDNIETIFRHTKTDQEDLYQLDKWHDYEQSNPQIFAGMYQFWCQKVA